MVKVNFGILENNYGVLVIPNYNHWLKNMQDDMEIRGAELKINDDGSVTLAVNGKSVTRPNEVIKGQYDADVKKWKASGLFIKFEGESEER